MTQVRPDANFGTAAWLEEFGRVSEGQDQNTVQRELAALTKDFAAVESASASQDMAGYSSIRLSCATGVPADSASGAISFFVVLVVLSALVMVIPAGNVASMLRSQAVARRREMVTERSFDHCSAVSVLRAHPWIQRTWHA